METQSVIRVPDIIGDICQVRMGSKSILECQKFVVASVVYRFQSTFSTPTYRISIVVVRRICECGIPFFFFRAGPRRLRRAGLARFVRLTQVGKSADHQLASPADLPTKLS